MVQVRALLLRTFENTSHDFLAVCVTFKILLSPQQPDLLNFKKGWMVKLDEQGQVGPAFIVRMMSVNSPSSA